MYIRIHMDVCMDVGVVVSYDGAISIHASSQTGVKEYT